MASGRLGLHDALDYGLGVLEAGEDFFGAAVALDQAELEGAVVALLVYVRDGAHERATNDFGVVVEKVDLNRAIGQVEDDGVARAQPGAQEGQARHFITGSGLDGGTSLQKMLAHVVAEVFEKCDFLL